MLEDHRKIPIILDFHLQNCYDEFSGIADSLTSDRELFHRENEEKRIRRRSYEKIACCTYGAVLLCGADGMRCPIRGL